MLLTKGDNDYDKHSIFPFLHTTIQRGGKRVNRVIAMQTFVLDFVAYVYREMSKKVVCVQTKFWYNIH